MNAMTNRPTDLAPRLLGATGVSLLLAAAISLVSARWELFGPGARLAVLLVASAVVVGSTVPLRRLAPATARLLDVLVAAMVPIDTAAAVIVTGGSWRAALVAAGPLTVLAGVVLGRRAHASMGDAAIVVGGCLTVAGVAAETGIHGPVLLGVLAAVGAGLAASLVPRRVVVTFGALAGLAPVGRLLDEAVFTGMGTLREIGLIATPDLTSALMAGCFAVGALGLLAVNARSPYVGLLALVAAMATGFEVWAIVEPPGHVGFLAVAAAVALVQLVDPARLGLSEELAALVDQVNEALLVAMTGVVVAGSWSKVVDDPGIVAETPLAAAVLAAGWVVGDLRRDELWTPALPGGVVCSVIATYLVSDDLRWLAAGLLASGAVLLLSTRPGATALGFGSVVAAPFVAVGAWDARATSLIAGGAVALATLGTVRAGRTRDSLVGFGAAVVLIHAMVAGLAAATAWSGLGGIEGEAIGVALVAALWWGAGRSLSLVQSAAGCVLMSLAAVAPAVLLGHHPNEALVLAGVVTGVTAIDAALTRSRERVAVAALGSAVVYLAVLAAADVGLRDAYLVPLVWAGVAAALATGAPRTPLHLTGLAATLLITVGGRLEDGASIHIAILGGVAVVVAVLAGRAGDDTTLAVAGPTAMGAASFDLLDRSVGIESWGWLVVGGVVAVSAAVLLERRDADLVSDSSVV